jgi:hypothetical protein
VHVDEGEIDMRAVEQGEAVATIVGDAQPQRQPRRARRVGQKLLDGVTIVGNEHADIAGHRGAPATVPARLARAVPLRPIAVQRMFNRPRLDWFCVVRNHGCLSANGSR